MKVLVIGGGGREHALVWKLHQSAKVNQIYCIPGNAGIAEIANCVKLPISDFPALAAFARVREIDLTIVGPENPLVDGIVDVFEAYGLRIFGPNKEASQMEGSKIFAKQLMQRHNIPTAEAAMFNNYDKAVAYVQENEPPFVVKADGLAAGKGVTVAFDQKTTLQALKNCFIEKRFGLAGTRVMIEEYLIGEEVSVFVLTDGKALVPMAPAQDYKPVFDGNNGPNTGGMGSYSPVPVLSDRVYKRIVEKIMTPVIDALASEGIKYKGVLYGGLVLTDEGPKVLEFNCRFGDPETQAILPRFDGDLAQVLSAVAEERLEKVKFSWKDQACVSVVAASAGYPGDYKTGIEISGLKEASEAAGISIFHAGSAYKGGKVVTAGGRVLNVSALGDTFSQARDKAYDALKRISFKGMHYRTDIALGPSKFRKTEVVKEYNLKPFFKFIKR